MILTKENINETSLIQEKSQNIVKEKKLVPKEKIANELKLVNNIYQDKKRNINKRKTNLTKELNSNSTTKMKLKSFSIMENKNVYKKDNLNIIKNKELLNNKDEIRDFLIKTDNEMNILSYRDALILDKRSFCEYYFSLIRIHQIVIFTIHSKKDYNSRVIKICYFFFIYSLILVINILFIDDATLYSIRLIESNNENIKINFVKIIITTIISYLIKEILSSFIFSEKIFLKLRNKSISNKKLILGNFGMRCVSFFGLIIIILFIFIYYIMCFFAVFPKIQIFVLEISSISFILFLLIPMIINILPAIFRLYSLGPNKGKLFFYRFSQFLQLI